MTDTPREPTSEEVEALRKVLGWNATKESCIKILTNYEPRTSEPRCDGSGWLYGRGYLSESGVRTSDPLWVTKLKCCGCSRCAKPQATPKSDGGLAASESTTGGNKPPTMAAHDLPGLRASPEPVAPTRPSPSREDFEETMSVCGTRAEEVGCMLGVVLCQQRDLLTEIRDLIARGK